MQIWKPGGWVVLFFALLGRVGDLDFVITRIQDPGWVGEALRWFFPMPIALTILLIIIGFFLFWLAEKNAKFPKANLEDWRHVHIFYIWQAGCLWKGLVPEQHVQFRNPAYPKFTMLLRAAQVGELETMEEYDENDGSNTQVFRDELEIYARNIGEVPAFLFPRSLFKKLVYWNYFPGVAFFVLIALIWAGGNFYNKTENLILSEKKCELLKDALSSKTPFRIWILPVKHNDHAALASTSYYRCLIKHGWPYMLHENNDVTADTYGLSVVTAAGEDFFSSANALFLERALRQIGLKPTIGNQERFPKGAVGIVIGRRK